MSSDRRTHDYQLHTQLREAARSGPRNIAEGFGRYGNLLNHLQEAFDSGYLSDAERLSLEHAAKKAIKAANGLIRYLESNPS